MAKKKNKPEPAPEPTALLAAQQSDDEAELVLDVAPDPDDATNAGTPTAAVAVTVKSGAGHYVDPVTGRVTRYHPDFETKRGKAMYKLYEGMGIARSMAKLAERVADEERLVIEEFRPKTAADYKRAMAHVAKHSRDAQWQRRARNIERNLREYSRTYGWVERAAVHDAEVAEQYERERMAARLEMDDRQALLGATMQSVAAGVFVNHAKQENKVSRDVVAALVGGVQIERTARGSANSIQEQRGSLSGNLGIGVSGGLAPVTVSGDISVHHDGQVGVQVGGAVQVVQFNVDMIPRVHEALAAWRAQQGLPSPQEAARQNWVESLPPPLPLPALPSASE